MGFVRVQWHCIQSWTRGPVSPSCGGGEKVISYSRSSSITDYLTHPETVLHSLDCLNQGNLPPPPKKKLWKPYEEAKQRRRAVRGEKGTHLYAAAAEALVRPGPRLQELRMPAGHLTTRAGPGRRARLDGKLGPNIVRGGAGGRAGPAGTWECVCACARVRVAGLDEPVVLGFLRDLSQGGPALLQVGRSCRGAYLACEPKPRSQAALPSPLA